ncbi:MAG: YheV family putative metal-binding protein [Halioglobus sp.]
MHKSPPKRRFIAGAVCPRCSLMDKIVVEVDSDARHCISCGFSEARPTAQTPQHSTEVPTRVNRASARRIETPAEAVKLVDPSASQKKQPNDNEE